jgi:capsular polysaccharide biosynthesis protein
VRSLRAVIEERLESGRYLRALREHWPYILGTIVLAVAAAGIFLATATKRYEAGTDVLVAPVPADAFVGIPLFRESDVSRSVVTAGRVATSPEVVEGVKQRLHLRASREELLSHVSVAPQQQSNILTITGKASTPEEAVRIANAFALVLVERRTAELQREVGATVTRLSAQARTLRARGNATEATALANQISTLRTLIGASDPTLQVVSRAVAPEQPSWPRPVLSVAVALVAGLLLGMGIAIAIELLNPLVLAETDILEPGSPPILGRLTRRNTNTAYRGVWANLAARAPNRRPPKTVLLTTADRGDSPALLAAGLAEMLALAGRHVVIVDGDPQGGAAANLLHAPHVERSGIRSALVDGASVEDVLVPTPQVGDRVRVLTSHPDDEMLFGLVPLDRIEALVDDLKHCADVVLFVAPSPADTPDTFAVAEVVDAVIVTVEIGHTRRARLAELRRDLGQRAIAPAGFFVIGKRFRRPRISPVRIAGGHARVRPRASRREPTYH